MKRRSARSCLIKLFVALFAGTSLLAQASLPAQANDGAIVAFAQQAALRAVNFSQGDIASLTRARADFTPEGWTAFMKHMDGFLDQQGAPTFNSSFVPSKDAAVIGREGGIVHVRLPGTLKQTQRQSSSTYHRAAIDVYVSGAPMKIQRLEQTTCLGASTSCQ
jgi:hypothetical protein